MAARVKCNRPLLWFCSGLLILISLCIILRGNVLHIEFSKSESLETYRDDLCQIDCVTGKPCEYKDEVDFRIMVITFDRAKSMKKCLDSIMKLDTMGDKVSVEVWLDRDKKRGLISKEAEEYAEDFVKQFRKLGSNVKACIHKQQRNAYITGQWVDTWRPKAGTRELGLILEDDVSVAPMAYRWLKNVHRHYGNQTDTPVAGYTLQMESINFFGGKKRPMKGPKDQMVFLYPIIGTWGYAPHPESWRDFQDWYAQVRPDRSTKTDKIKPYVPGIIPTSWYKNFEKKGTQESMWEMWHIKYAEVKKVFTVYSNLNYYTKRNDVLLSNNRMEKGLHYSGGKTNEQSHKLLKSWEGSFEKLPKISDIAHFNYNGSVCTKSCCFTTQCK